MEKTDKTSLYVFEMLISDRGPSGRTVQRSPASQTPAAGRRGGEERERGGGSDGTGFNLVMAGQRFSIVTSNA